MHPRNRKRNLLLDGLEREREGARAEIAAADLFSGLLTEIVAAGESSLAAILKGW